MKTNANFLLTFVGFFLFINQSNAQDSWTKKANFPGAGRIFSSGFSIGNHGYVAVGDTTTPNNPIKPTNDFWEYNADSNTWVQKVNVPGNLRIGAICFSIGNKGYIGCGSGGTDFWEYDPAKNSWIRKADCPGIPRVGGVGFSIAGKGYMGLGFNPMGGTDLIDFWEYDTTANRWTQKSDFPGSSRSYSVGFSIGNKGFMGTGVDGSPAYYNDFWEYDPLKDKWIQKANIGNNGRYCGIGFSIANEGYIGFGYIDQTGVRNDMWSYDTTGDQWTQMSYCDTGFVSFSPFAFSIGNRGYVGSGSTFYRGVVNDFYQYTNHTSGINSPKNQVDFEIYPNPSAGNFVLNSFYPIESYEVCDMHGKEINKDFVQTEGNSINVNLSLPNGIYLVRVISNQGTSVKKIVVAGN